MTREGAFRLADKVTWREWTLGGSFVCSCGDTVVCRSSREATLVVYRGHLLHCH